MGMSVSCDGCGLEYAGRRGLGGLFPHRSNSGRTICGCSSKSPASTALLEAAGGRRRRRRRCRSVSSRRIHRFTDYFRAHFLVPMVSAVWSCGPGTAMDYPARYLFRFLDNHGMLAIRGAPQWRTVVGGSRTYVELIAKALHDVQLATPSRASGAPSNTLTCGPPTATRRRSTRWSSPPTPTRR